MELYPYQRECLAALWDYWKANSSGRPILVCPTGSGKSFIVASIIEKISKRYPRYRFLIATHTKEIVSQNATELQGVMPAEPIGIYSAGLNQKVVRRITFGNIQSLYKRARDLQFDMLIVDECHLIARNEDTMYQKTIDALTKNNPRMLILGLTATPMRLDQGSLIAEGSTFTDIAYNIGIRELIDGKYLSPLVSMAKKAVDLTGVKTSGYDYNQTDLQGAFDKEALIDMHCKDIIKCAGERKHWLIFCSGIQHAEDVCNKFRELGIAADFVHGEMMNMERDHKIAKFKDGSTRALCNVGVLTTGFNFRAVDCVVLLRATKSASLYIQCVGRGTRIADSKLDCLVLDYGGNIERHGPIDMVYVKPGKDKKAEVGVSPFKRCPECGCCVPPRTAMCPSCEYVFPDNTQNLEIKPTTSPILSAIEEVEIDYREVKRHLKEGKPDSFKIVYHAGMRMFMDFLCFDHGGFAATQAAKKWYNRGGQLPAPRTVEEALLRKDELSEVRTLRVIRREKFHEILSAVLESKESQQNRQRKEQETWEAENPL